jgi:hypothetical protein
MWFSVSCLFLSVTVRGWFFVQVLQLCCAPDWTSYPSGSVLPLAEHEALQTCIKPLQVL